MTRIGRDAGQGVKLTRWGSLLFAGIAGLVAIPPLLFFEHWLLAGVLGLTWLLLAISLSDLKTGYIPRALNLTVAMLGLAFAKHGLGWASALAGGAFMGLLLQTVRLIYRRARGCEGLGFGDVLLASGGGIWVGLDGCGPMLLIASSTALLFVTLTGQLKDLSRSIRFAPALAFGIYLSVLVLR